MAQEDDLRALGKVMDFMRGISVIFLLINCYWIWTVLFSGFVFFFLNWWLLVLPIGKVGAASLYIFTLSVGYICLLMGGVWMSRLLKNNLMDDVFNTENESFMQETRLMENEYSVNLPTRFYYKKK